MLSTCSGPMECDPLTVSERLDWAAIGRYVLGRCTSEGGYCFYRTPEWAVEEPNAPDTLAALESLRLWEIDLPVPQRTGLWLRSLQDSRGGYPTLTIGWAPLRALDVLAVEPACSPDHRLRAWVEVLASRDRPRDQRAAIVDASHLVELVRLRRGTLRGRDRDGIAALLDASRIPYEGWARPGADLETTAKAVRLAQLMDVHWHSDVELVTFLRRCEDELLGLQLAPGVRGNRCRSAVGRAQAQPRPRPKHPLSRRRRTATCPAAATRRRAGCTSPGDLNAAGEVKEMIRLSVEGCRRNGIHSGLCGQAPSDYPDMAEFLVEIGIDSMSLNPDTMLKTTNGVLELEQRLGRTSPTARDE